ncbi:uncharacterized protein N7473_008334 [Penicillium subrubescens]|jgi:hypothetical protein|uniref:Transcription factor domain-containing protein n=1 Tax=Penicillium subrubescens TaxID=1316194 RepID=A0A1Q5TH01_9EURO|nr:uncharacterized protein N7473_008334 [Penicillium subrubescens]KAJ5892106.1 hypothetical protein N7473_008334 [Penicillium subrubescens]OKO99516.1 hypothetical protein PENSUB_8361 [Penicillium subrubescens]
MNVLSDRRVGGLKYQIYAPLPLEIAKEYDQSAIRFLVNGLREYPTAFVKGYKTDFIHPDIYKSGLPAAIRDTHAICKVYAQHDPQGDSCDIFRLLRTQSNKIHRQIARSSTFEELLGCTQALILIQCILALDRDPLTQYSETTSAMLEKLAKRLWEQAPVLLPSTLSPRQAWLFAESVRRTIIVSLMIRSAHSLKTRNYSVRTPFVDSLPFDIRTALWDATSDHSWTELNSESPDSMISLHGYSYAMERARVHDIGNFGALILAACRGKEVSRIPYPPMNSYMPT